MVLATASDIDTAAVTLPKGWTLAFVEDHVRIATGGKNTQDRVDDGEYPFFVRSQTVERINSYSFDGEAVLTAGDGVGTGKIFHYVNGRFDVHQRVYRMTDFSDSLHGYYFFLAFSHDFYHRIMQMTAKSSVDSVRREMIARMQIRLPPLAEQEAIAEALSDADALIESLEQLIAKKRQIKQGAMQELLTGKRRLPGFETRKGTHLTELGPLPRDWTLTTVGQEFSIQLGKMLDAQKNVGEPKPFLGNRSVQWGRIDISSLGLMKMTHTDQQRYRLHEGDLLACEGGEVARCAIWRAELEECYYQKAIHRLRSRGDCGVEFLSYVLELYARRGLLDSYTTGTGIAHLPKDKFETVPLPLPPSSDERDAICLMLSDMDAEIAACDGKLEKARHIKQGMMHNLLTGKIRLV